MRDQSTSDDLLLKDIILSVRDYSFFLLSKWKLVLISALLGATLMYIRYRIIPAQFQAELTFMINEESSSSSAGIGNVLGALGIGNASDVNLEKILELAKSRRIFQNAFFEKVSIDGKVDFYANHFIDELRKQGQWMPNKWYEFWKQESPLMDFSFTNDSIEGFSRLENLSLQELHRTIRRRIDMNVTELTQIMSMTMTFYSEPLTIKFLKELYVQLSQFYIEKTVEKQLATLELVQAKKDSIFGLLNSKEYALAKREDSYRGYFLEQEGVPSRQLNRDINMLTLIYGETVKNHEIADFSLKNRVPYVQLIDEPIEPALAIKGGPMKSITRGLLLGAILSIFFLIISRIFKTIIDNE